MKKHTLFFLLLSLTFFVSSCGKKSAVATSSVKAVEASPIVAEKPVTNVNAPFVGLWGGYLENSYTTITIKADGSASIKAIGEPARVRSIYLQDNRYYLVNNETKTGVPLKVNGNMLTITLNKTEVSFNKDE